MNIRQDLNVALFAARDTSETYVLIAWDPPVIFATNVFSQAQNIPP